MHGPVGTARTSFEIVSKPMKQGVCNSLVLSRRPLAGRLSFFVYLSQENGRHVYPVGLPSPCLTCVFTRRDRPRALIEVPQLLKDLSRSLLGRLISLGIFALGFWVLYQGLLRDDNPLLLGLGVIVGSVLILGGLYLMATTRRLAARRASEQDAQRDLEQEEPTVDSLDGSGKSD